MNLLAAVKGQVYDKELGSLLLKVGNFILRILCDNSTIEKSFPGDEIELYTHLEFNQNEFILYGFSTKEKLYVFEKILKVSKIGPKTALRIVGSLEPEEFVYLVTSQNVDKLSQIQGIGRKTAERLVAELKDENFDIKSTYSSELFDAVEALMALGFSKIESMDAARSVYKDKMNTEQIVKEALKKLSKRV
ncbi:MAG TPA: Holliday junction branch migration protein RuvA [Pseudothermotoga sp.]